MSDTDRLIFPKSANLHFCDVHRLSRLVRNSIRNGQLRAYSSIK